MGQGGGWQSTNGGGGTSGYSGYSGYSGSGTSGYSGYSGKSGYSGVNGNSGITQYAYFWQSVSDVAGTIASNNGKVLFQTASPNNTAAITTVAASGDITIGAGGGGTYKINQFVSGVEANAFVLFINGSKAAGTVYGSGAGAQQNGGFSIVLLADGDVISLRSDNCASAIALALAGTTDTDQIVGSILLIKF